MSAKRRNYIAWLLDTIGLAIIVTEVVRAQWFGHRMEPLVIAVGCMIGFIGFYLTNPPGAIAAGTFIVDSTVKVVGVVRSGRRTTDPIVPATAVVPIDPAKPPQEAP